MVRKNLPLFLVFLDFYLFLVLTSPTYFQTSHIHISLHISFFASSLIFPFSYNFCLPFNDLSDNHPSTRPTQSPSRSLFALLCLYLLFWLVIILGRRNCSHAVSCFSRFWVVGRAVSVLTFVPDSPSCTTCTVFSSLTHSCIIMTSVQGDCIAVMCEFMGRCTMCMLCRVYLDMLLKE